MAWGRKQLWYGILALNLGIILLFWWQGSGDLLGQGLASIAVALGRLSGLAAAVTVLLQFVFMGRTPWLERTFGLEKLAQVHHVNGKLTLLFLILHPVLLTWGYSRGAGVGLITQFKSFLFAYEHVLYSIDVPYRQGFARVCHIPWPIYDYAFFDEWHVVASTSLFTFDDAYW